MKWLVVAALATAIASGSLWIAGRRTEHDPPMTDGHEPPKLQPALKRENLALSVGSVTLERVRQLHREGQRQLYNSNYGPEFLKSRELLQQARSLLEQLDDSTDEIERLYWRARIYFELGNWHQGAAYGDASQAQEALPYFGAAEQLALELTQRAPGFSDGHRLLGETKMRITSLKGWAHALVHTGTAKSSLDRALELDSQNAEAHLALGVYYLYAPGLLGGSPQKAVEELKKVETLGDETTRFLAHRWQGVAYAKLGQIEEAQQHFLKALAIYPKSSWDRNELKKLQR